MPAAGRGAELCLRRAAPAGGRGGAGAGRHHGGELQRVRYDAVGNRTVRDVVSPLLTGTETYAYDAFSNRLLSTAGVSGGIPIQTRTLSHGDSGNRTVDNAAGAVANVAYTMTYDATDRLTEVSNAGIPLGSYLHNAMGQRVSKIVGVTTTHYLYDLSGRLIGEADGTTGATTAEYIAFEGINLAYITTAGIFWVHADHLDTPQVLTDATGAVAWSALYSPFGLAEVTGGLVFNPRFPGQYADAETGYYYNYFRTYDPTSGRYVESDPIGLGGGWNTYGYVGGNPVMRVDPRGLSQADINQMNLLAIQLNPDLKIEYPVCVDALEGNAMGEHRPKLVNGKRSGTICVSKSFLVDEQMSCGKAVILYKVIVHEGIHKTKWVDDGVTAGPDHDARTDDVYKEAERIQQRDEVFIRQMRGCTQYACEGSSPPFS